MGAFRTNLVHLKIRPKKGHNEEKKGQKEGFEGAMPKEVAKKVAEGAPLKGR